MLKLTSCQKIAIGKQLVKKILKRIKNMVDEKNIEQEELVQNEPVPSEETETTETPQSDENPLAAELAEYKDKFIRLYSEFENFRKRTQKEKADFMLTANKDLILSLLPVVDDFERANKAYETSQSLESFKEGVDLIFNKFTKALEAKGLKPINATGELFDTELHEAITQIPAPTEELKGKVVDEIEKGYFLGEKVIRYSKVVIGQ